MDPQQQREQRYAELFEQYRNPTRARTSSESRDLSARLRVEERMLLEHPPPGKKKGLLLPSEMEHRPKGPKLNALRLEDFQTRIFTDAECRDLISDPNRTPPLAKVTYIFDQDGVGSCGAEGSEGAAKVRRQQDRDVEVVTNPWFTYHFTSGGVDRGSVPEDNLASMQQRGVPSQAVWPRSKGWKAKPSDEAMQDGLKHRLAMDGVVEIHPPSQSGHSWPKLRTMILRGFPVPFGYRGHWIFAADLIDLDRLEYPNSWGKDWNGNGRSTLHWKDIYWQYGVWAIIATTSAEN